VGKRIEGVGDPFLVGLQGAIARNRESLPRYFRKMKIDPRKGTIGGKKVEKIGEGGRGFVYKVYDPGRREYVALKVNKKWLGGGAAAKIGERPALAMSGTYPRPAALLDVYCSDMAGNIIVSEFCEGGSWKKTDVLADRRLLEENFVFILSTLKAIHEKRVVLMDIKPENFLVKNGFLFFGDFEDAIQCTPDGQIAREEEVTITELYEAPELSFGAGNGNSDLRLHDNWTVGISFCEKILGLVAGGGELQTMFVERLRDLKPRMGFDVQYTSRYIVRYPDEWNNFIRSTLNRVNPPVGYLMKTALAQLLEGRREQAVHIDYILDGLENSYRSVEHRKEYDRLCTKKHEHQAIARRQPERALGGPATFLRMALEWLRRVSGRLFVFRVGRATSTLGCGASGVSEGAAQKNHR
jgi:serine/threonine protein kinase